MVVVCVFVSSAMDAMDVMVALLFAVDVIAVDVAVVVSGVVTGFIVV